MNGILKFFVWHFEIFVWHFENSSWHFEKQPIGTLIFWGGILIVTKIVQILKWHFDQSHQNWHFESKCQISEKMALC